MAYRRRGMRRRVAGKRKPRYYRRRGGARSIPRLPRFRGQGYLNLVRMAPNILVQNGANPGVPVVTDPTGSCITLGTLVPNPNGTTWDVPFSMQFNLAQLANSQDITQLCDAYKIKYVRVKAWNTSQYGTNGYVTSRIKWITDHDDATPPSVGDMNQKMGTRTVGFYDDRCVKMGVCPRVAQPAYRDTPLPFAYSIPKSVWINSTYNNVPHYSIKGVIEDFALGGVGIGVVSQIRFEVQMYVVARDFQ